MVRNRGDRLSDDRKIQRPTQPPLENIGKADKEGLPAPASTVRDQHNSQKQTIEWASTYSQFGDLVQVMNRNAGRALNPK